MRLGALILAGGRSLRMGRPKEWLPWADTTLLGHLCHNLREVTAPILVLARDREQSLPTLPPAVEILTDERREAGPLAGLVQGLEHLVASHGFDDGDALLLTACDQPFLTGDVVRGLLAHLPGHDVVLPVAAGREQPLAALYRVAVRTTARAMLEQGAGSPRAVAAARTTCRLADDQLAAVDPTGRAWWNLNTPADYERARSSN